MMVEKEKKKRTRRFNLKLNIHCDSKRNCKWSFDAVRTRKIPVSILFCFFCSFVCVCDIFFFISRRRHYHQIFYGVFQLDRKRMLSNRSKWTGQSFSDRMVRVNCTFPAVVRSIKFQEILTASFRFISISRLHQRSRSSPVFVVFFFIHRLNVCFIFLFFVVVVLSTVREHVCARVWVCHRKWNK